jgi:O-antigen/teichoic acid export membrane protein
MLKRNIVYSALGQAIILLLGLLSTKFIFKELGAEILGIINFSLIISSLLISLMDLGISPVVTREIAAHRFQDLQYIKDIVGTASFLAWGGVAIAGLGVIILAPIFTTHWLQLEDMSNVDVVLALQIITISLLLGIPRSMYGAIVAGYERIDLVSVANVLTTGLQQAGLILIIGFGGELFNVAIWYGFSSICGVFIFATAVLKLGDTVDLWPKFNLNIIYRNYRYSFLLCSNSTANYFVTQIDKWMISKWLSVSTLGFYGFAFSLSSKGSILPNSIVSAAFPALSASVANRKKSEWVEQYQKLQDLCCYLSVPVFAAMAMLGIVVTGFVFNDEIVRMLWLPLLILSIGQLMSSMLYVPAWLTFAMKKPELSLKTNLLAVIIVVPPIFYLIYNYGLLGAAFSPALYCLWQFAYFIPRIYKECLQSSPLDWYLRSGGMSAMGCLIFGISWAGAWSMGEGLAVKGLLAAFTIGTMAFLLAGWFFLGSNLRQVLLNFMSDPVSVFNKK